MSTPGSTLLGCENVQDELNKYFFSDGCDPAVFGFPSPFNEFLWSPMNRSNLQQQINPAKGKLRTVILRYDQELAPAERKSYSEVTCQSDNERGDLSQSYDIDPDDIVEDNELMDSDQWFYTCRTNPEIILRKIALLIKSVREGTYKKTAEEFFTGTMWGQWGKLVEDAGGDYVVTDDKLEVKTKKTGSDDIFPTTMQIIQNALEMTGYCNTAFITGGRILYDYWQLMRAGCCSNQGLDLSKIFAEFPIAVTWDKYLQQAYNDPNISVALQPKALQLIYFNRYASKVEEDNALGKRFSTYDKFVINDPVTGMPMNVLISDNCPSGISISIHTNTKLVQLPYDIFRAGGDQEGVTFVNQVEVSNS